MKLFLYLFLIFSISAQASGNESDKAADEIKAIITVLEKDYPSLIKRLDSDKKAREKLIRNFVHSFSAGIEYIPSGEKFEETKALPENKAEIFNIINIASNKVTYIRLDSFTPAIVAALKNDAEMVAGFSEKPSGIVIDLRNSRGGDTVSALKAARLFCHPEDVPGCPEGSDLKKLFERPIVILTSGKTENSPELFGALLEKSGHAIVMGKYPEGKPFPMKSVSLPNGSRLIFPDVPPELVDISAKPLVPLIIAEPFPQIDFKRLSSETGAGSSDHALSRAVDLLISIGVIREKMKRD
ncbi:MAG: hypothetical protein A2020_03025 [Lentisphaerae bacterium GWF2_45_14]|nr:MAG: hypothetical protein A2020_03025 [Lentisphaerae bacterium GWF2_45_14]